VSLVVFREHSIQVNESWTSAPAALKRPGVCWESDD